MGFALTEEQTALAGAVREVLDEQCPPAHARSCAEDPQRRTGALWKALSELGVFAVLIPEEHGGLGLTEVEAALVAEELGRACVPGPVAETALVVPSVLAHASDGALREQWLPQLAAGLVATALAEPDGYALDAGLAGLVLLSNGERLVAAVPSDLELTEQPGIDPTQNRYKVLLPGPGAATGFTIPGTRTAREALLDRGALAVAAQLTGLAGALLDQSVAYAKDRVQFGRPIGSFQAVKHKLADVHVAVEFTRPLVLRAAYSMAMDASTVSRDVSAALSTAADTAELAARTALQVHGAIGYTEELDLQLWLKRVWSLTDSWGGATYHRARVLSLLLASPDERVARLP